MPSGSTEEVVAGVAATLVVGSGVELVAGTSGVASPLSSGVVEYRTGNDRTEAIY